MLQRMYVEALCLERDDVTMLENCSVPLLRISQSELDSYYAFDRHVVIIIISTLLVGIRFIVQLGLRHLDSDLYREELFGMGS